MYVSGNIRQKRGKHDVRGGHYVGVGRCTRQYCVLSRGMRTGNPVMFPSFPMATPDSCVWFRYVDMHAHPRHAKYRVNDFIVYVEFDHCGVLVMSSCRNTLPLITDAMFGLAGTS